MIRDGVAKDGMVIYAEEQTAGRGQKNHVWESKKHENIMFSAVLDTSWLSINDQFKLSCAVALACSDFFSAYAGDETCIKWPNDLYWRDRKAGGILIENVIKGKKWEHAIIGIGININQTEFGSMKHKPVSLKQITGKNFDNIFLTKQLCTNLDGRIQELKNKQFNAQLSIYNDRLFMKNKSVLFQSMEEEFLSIVKGVNEHGQLVVLNNGPTAFNHGEIEWKL